MSRHDSPHGGFLFHAHCRSRLFELARVLMRFNHVASRIENANHSIM
jgi:hypothetical protein